METFINYGPKTWVENRESGVVKSLTVKIKGWKSINSNNQFTIQRDMNGEGIKLFTAFDVTSTADVEEEHVLSIPTEHQTDTVYYIKSDHTHDKSLQSRDDDVEYNTKSGKWIELLEADSDFLNKVDFRQ